MWLLIGCSAAEPTPAVKQAANACLPGSGAFLRATLRGALNADIDWRDAQLSCEGSARPDGRGLRITLAGPLPAAPGAAPRGLLIAGADKVWKPASGEIKGSDLIVSSPEVSAPVAARYAWAENPSCNLVNGAGLPATSFRTDDWPVPTAKK